MKSFKGLTFSDRYTRLEGGALVLHTREGGDYRGHIVCEGREYLYVQFNGVSRVDRVRKEVV